MGSREPEPGEVRVDAQPDSDRDRSSSALVRVADVAARHAGDGWITVLVGANGAVLLRELHARWAPLGLDDYRSLFVADGLLRGSAVFILVLQLCFVLALRRRVWDRDDGTDRALQAIIAVSVATLAIGFTLYARNEYLDRLHLIDRVLLLALAVGSVLRVAVLPGFLLHCYVLVGQFRFPLGSYSWTDKLAIFEALWAVQIALAWQEVVGRPRRDDPEPVRSAAPIYAAMVVIGAWYLSAGLNKVRIRWWSATDLSNLVKSAWAEGWLRSIDAGVVDDVAAVLSVFNPVLIAATLVIEVVCVFLLFAGHRLRLIALGSFVALHVSIFLLTGIFFWKWVALDVVLALVLFRRRWPIDRRTALSACASLVVLQSQVPTNLAWVDSPVTHVFHVVAVDQDGREFVVPERYFAPFQLIISQDRFGYLTDEPLVADAYGTLERSIDADLLEDLTAEDLAAFRREHGVVRYSEPRARIFDDLVRRQCSSWIGRSRLDGWPILPPPHIWTTDPPQDVPAPDRVTEVFVRLETWFLDDLEQGPVSSSVVRRIDVSDGCGGA